MIFEWFELNITMASPALIASFEHEFDPVWGPHQLQSYRSKLLDILSQGPVEARDAALMHIDLQNKSQTLCPDSSQYSFVQKALYDPENRGVTFSTPHNIRVVYDECNFALPKWFVSKYLTSS